MALPSADIVKTAVETIYSALSNDKTSAGSRTAVQALNEIRDNLSRLYPVIDIVITSDADDLGVSEFISAEATMSVGVVLRKQGTASFDLDDNSFATAKGSALSDGDIFVLSGADAVVYLGNGTQHAFDFDGETAQDFVSIGS